MSSAKVDILTRYLGFFSSLRSSASYEVQVLSRYLARDIQSVTGKNLRFLHDLSHLDPWSTSKGKLRGALTLAEVVEVPVRDRWRLPYLSSLLAQRRRAYELVLEAETSILDDIINSLVKN